MRILYERLFQAFPDAVLVVDRDGSVVVSNQRARRMFGGDSEELQARSIDDLVPMRHRASHALHLAGYFEQPRARLMGAGMTLYARRLDGQEFPVDVMLSPLPTDEGPLAMCAIRDVSERLATQQRLTKSEASLREAQALGRMGSWEMRHADGAIEWSDEIYRIFELPAEFSPTYESFLERVHPEDRARVHDAFEASVRLHRDYRVDHRLLMHDGRIKHLHERGHTMYSPQGVPLRSVGTVQDITERKQVEAALLRSEARLAGIVDGALDAIISVDDQGRVLVFNGAAERMFGVSREQALGSPVNRFVPRWSVDGQRAFGEAVHRNGATPGALGGETVLAGLRADGTEFPIEVSLSIVTVDNAALTTAILRDVTQRLHDERELVRYQLELAELTHRLMEQERATSRHLAQALHDKLGQTLGAMRIDFVREARFDDARLAARHARVDHYIDRAMSEVRQALDDLRPMLLDEFGLAEALGNDVATAQARAESAHVVFECKPELQHQRWGADIEYALFMIARESIANALAHARPATVRVVLDGNAEEVTLEVSDDGLGMTGPLIRPGHLGMVGMRERALAIGARFEVRSDAGVGTTVSVRWHGAAA